MGFSFGAVCCQILAVGTILKKGYCQLMLNPWIKTCLNIEHKGMQHFILFFSVVFQKM
jgi:hypothetical protein